MVSLYKYKVKPKIRMYSRLEIGLETGHRDRGGNRSRRLLIYAVSSGGISVLIGVG